VPEKIKNNSKTNEELLIAMERLNQEIATLKEKKPVTNQP